MPTAIPVAPAPAAAAVPGFNNHTTGLACIVPRARYAAIGFHHRWLAASSHTLIIFIPITTPPTRDTALDNTPYTKAFFIGTYSSPPTRGSLIVMFPALAVACTVFVFGEPTRPSWISLRRNSSHATESDSRDSHGRWRMSSLIFLTIADRL